MGLHCRHRINQIVLIGYGGVLVIRGELPLGAGLFVFANLIHEFANQVGQIINIANSIQTSLTGAERIFAVLDAEIEIESSPEAVRLPKRWGELRSSTFSLPIIPRSILQCQQNSVLNRRVIQIPSRPERACFVEARF